MDVSVIILTLNEELHISRCLEKIEPLKSTQVFVVDCFSSDKTIALARSHGVEVVQHAWPGTQAAQFNWALEHLPIKSEWVLRLDADEYLTASLIEEIKECVPTLPPHVTGLVFPRYNVFQGKRMNRGTGVVPILRMFRFGNAVSESRLMDEHICLLTGESRELKEPFVDHNLNTINNWTEKHNNYSMREAVELLDVKYGILEPNRESSESGRIGALEAQAAAKREKKLTYAKLPLFWRSFAYFLYRYLFKFGFVEGAEGFMWHFFQGLWYRMLVDAKIWEIERRAGVKAVRNPKAVLQKTLLEQYGVDCHARNPFEKPVRLNEGSEAPVSR